MKKMNLHLITLFIIFSTSSFFAQDYLTKITYQSCECLSSIEDTKDKDQFNLELGLCIIDASMPYKKEFGGIQTLFLFYKSRSTISILSPLDNDQNREYHLKLRLQ